MEAKEIYWLDELSKDYNDLVGKKCANLGELKKLGLRVPHGFALSVKAYEHFMDATGLGREVGRIVDDRLAGGVDMDRDVDRLIEVSARFPTAKESIKRTFQLVKMTATQNWSRVRKNHRSLPFLRKLKLKRNPRQKIELLSSPSNDFDWRALAFWVWPLG